MKCAQKCQFYSESKWNVGYPHHRHDKSLLYLDSKDAILPRGIPQGSDATRGTAVSSLAPVGRPVGDIVWCWTEGGKKGS